MKRSINNCHFNVRNLKTMRATFQPPLDATLRCRNKLYRYRPTNNLSSDFDSRTNRERLEIDRNIAKLAPSA